MQILGCLAELSHAWLLVKPQHSEIFLNFSNAKEGNPLLYPAGCNHRQNCFLMNSFRVSEISLFYRVSGSIFPRKKAKSGRPRGNDLF